MKNEYIVKYSVYKYGDDQELKVDFGHVMETSGVFNGLDSYETCAGRHITKANVTTLISAESGSDALEQLLDYAQTDATVVIKDIKKV